MPESPASLPLILQLAAGLDRAIDRLEAERERWEAAREGFSRLLARTLTEVSGARIERAFGAEVEDLAERLRREHPDETTLAAAFDKAAEAASEPGLRQAHRAAARRSRGWGQAFRAKSRRRR